MFHAPNQHRFKKKGHALASDDSFGNNGLFMIPHPKIKNYVFVTQVSDGEGWEHVSVSVAEAGKRQHRCPTWGEMCMIKQMFWDESDCVIQYHPEKSQYVNVHPFVLHLWRPIGIEIPIPDKIMVG